MRSFLKEFWEFLMERKKYWLFPILIVLMIFGVLIILVKAQQSHHLYIQFFKVTSILGLSAFYHDSAAAIIIDGKIVAAAQEERFSRKNMTLAIHLILLSLF